MTSKPATQIITKYTCIQYMNWPDTNYCIQIHQNTKSVYTKLARRATGTYNSISISQAPPPLLTSNLYRQRLPGMCSKTCLPYGSIEH